MNKQLATMAAASAHLAKGLAGEVLASMQGERLRILTPYRSRSRERQRQLATAIANLANGMDAIARALADAGDAKEGESYFDEVFSKLDSSQVKQCCSPSLPSSSPHNS